MYDGGTVNASFDLRGLAKLSDLVRFTLMFGDRATLPSRRYANPAIFAYIPEPIGAGTVLHQVGTIACSGICVVSPQSIEFRHAFPVVAEWVDQKYGHDPGGGCRLCSAPTAFAQPVCGRCYNDIGGDWSRLVRVR
ncbi:MAG: hypothetical protein ACRDUX_11495 [Mycobacterium sp.]